MVLDRVVPLNDVLLDFVEVVNDGMRVEPSLFRSWDFFVAQEQLENTFETDDSDLVSVDRAQRKDEIEYRKASAGSIKEYEPDEIRFLRKLAVH